jgi:hypothetical protein
LSRAPAKRTDTAPSGPPDAESYRLVSILPASAPSGSAGRDWLMYRIAQGKNMITGYRQGDIGAVTAEVERIVIGLNERRFVRRGRVDLRPSRHAAAKTEAASNKPS